MKNYFKTSILAVSLIFSATIAAQNVPNIIGIVNAQTQTHKNEQVTEQDSVYFYNDVDEKPSFGGKGHFDKGGFYEYLRENSCRCLFESFGWGAGFMMFIEFVIDTDGSLINVKAAKETDPLLDAEAVRVVRSSPKWIPGEKDGRTVKVKYVLPIRHIFEGCVVPSGWDEECKRCLQEKSG